MKTVSTLRLNLLRLFYLVLVTGIGNACVVHDDSPGLFNGNGFRGQDLQAVRALSPIHTGLRYPLLMLRVLFCEFTWKASSLLAVALPHWLRGKSNQDLGANTFAIGRIAV